MSKRPRDISPVLFPELYSSDEDSEAPTREEEKWPSAGGAMASRNSGLPKALKREIGRKGVLNIEKVGSGVAAPMSNQTKIHRKKVEWPSSSGAGVGSLELRRVGEEESDVAAPLPKPKDKKLARTEDKGLNLKKSRLKEKSKEPLQQWPSSKSLLAEDQEYKRGRGLRLEVVAPPKPPSAVVAKPNKKASSRLKAAEHKHAAAK